MKYLTILLSILINIYNAKSQTIEGFKLSLTRDCVHGNTGEMEIYSKSPETDGFIIKETFITGKNINDLKYKKEKIKNGLPIENTVNDLDSLFRLTEFTFTINNSIKDKVKSIKNRSLFCLTEITDIDKFFSHGDTVILNLKNLKPTIYSGDIIDGCFYKFSLKIKRSNQDTIEYKFNGNYNDMVQTTNIKYWLPIYLAYRKRPIFNTMPLEINITDVNLECVLIRFMTCEP